MTTWMIWLAVWEGAWEGTLEAIIDCYWRAELQRAIKQLEKQ